MKYVIIKVIHKDSPKTLNKTYTHTYTHKENITHKKIITVQQCQKEINKRKTNVTHSLTVYMNTHCGILKYYVHAKFHYYKFYGIYD